MGKYEKGTPKEIANRCKSKGLQKLRWFCQMCQKQCRDQNGFKCHLMSEAHQRQLLLFAENPDTYLKEYSVQFEKAFLTVSFLFAFISVYLYFALIIEFYNVEAKVTLVFTLV
uniref:DNA/RNA-binding protein Kin17 WH-like domain-containing protein n=1 Tax=Parascaris univalens TaxID=6257 RepID=A0A915BTV4_PARUN